jgi:uncharacterized protein UPF0175
VKEHGTDRPDSRRSCPSHECIWRRPLTPRLEALALEEFKNGHITKPELRRLLGFGTRYKLDGFLESHEVYEDYTMEDFEQDRDALKQLGF